MARTVARAATLAEFVAFLLCLVGLVFAGGQGVAEARIVEPAVDAEEVASEGDGEDGAVSQLPKSRRKGEASAAPGHTPSSARLRIDTGSGAPAIARLRLAVAPAPPACATTAGQAPRPCLAQIFLAPVRPRGPTAFRSIQ